jgi:hypothetical protein
VEGLRGAVGERMGVGVWQAQGEGVGERVVVVEAQAERVAVGHWVPVEHAVALRVAVGHWVPVEHAVAEGLALGPRVPVEDRVAQSVALPQWETLGVGEGQAVRDLEVVMVGVALGQGEGQAEGEWEALGEGVLERLDRSVGDREGVVVWQAQGEGVGERVVVVEAQAERVAVGHWVPVEHAVAEGVADAVADEVSRALRVLVLLGATKPWEEEGVGSGEERIWGSGCRAIVVKLMTLGMKVEGVIPAGRRQGSAVTTSSTFGKVRFLSMTSFMEEAFTGVSPMDLARKLTLTFLRLRVKPFRLQVVAFSAACWRLAAAAAVGFFAGQVLWLKTFMGCIGGQGGVVVCGVGGGGLRIVRRVIWERHERQCQKKGRGGAARGQRTSVGAIPMSCAEAGWSMREKESMKMSPN